jgi:hypothetical protein
VGADIDTLGTSAKGHSEWFIVPPIETTTPFAEIVMILNLGNLLTIFPLRQTQGQGLHQGHTAVSD